MNEIMQTIPAVETDQTANTSTFTNDLFGEVRVLVEDDNTVLFCATDVAKALGYRNPPDIVAKHCRYISKRYIPHPQAPDKTIEMLFIPESDVYRLVFGSKKPEAEKFTDWITREVIPNVLRQGYYISAGALQSPALISADIKGLQNQIAEMNRTLETAVHAIHALDFELGQSVIPDCEADEPYHTPRLLDMPQQRDYAMSQEHGSYRMWTIDQMYHAWISARVKLTRKDDCLASVSDIAADYGMTAKAFNKMLSDIGFQTYDKERQCWIPESIKFGNEEFDLFWKIMSYQNGNKIGYTTYWTEEGWFRLYSYLRWIDHNIYPDTWLNIFSPFMYPLIGQKYKLHAWSPVSVPDDDEEEDCTLKEPIKALPRDVVAKMTDDEFEAWAKVKRH